MEKLAEDYATHPFTHLAMGLFYAQGENTDYHPQKAYKGLVNAKNNWLSLSPKDIKKASEKNIDTIFISQTIDKLLNAELQKSLQKKSVEDLEQFSKDYPNTYQARKAIEEMYIFAYQKAETSNNVEAYFIFKQKYPNAPQALQAQSNIYKLAFAQAEQTHTAEAYQIFLQKYPDAPQKEEAEKRAEKLQYENFTKRGTQSELELYIQKYPRSPYLDDARKRLSASFLKNAKIMVSEPIVPKIEDKNLSTTFEIWFELNDEMKNRKPKYFIDVVDAKQVGQSDMIGKASGYYENELRISKTTPSIKNFSPKNIIAEEWVSVGNGKAYRYIIYAENQAFFTCVRQYYEDDSFKEEKVIFQQKTGEMLLEQAPASIDKALVNNNLREEYLLHHYRDLVSREGRKLKFKMYDDKTKIFVSDVESPREGAKKYIFRGYLDRFNAYIIDCIGNDFGVSTILRRDGKEIFVHKMTMGRSLGFSVSPEADRIVCFEEGNAIQMNIIRAEDALIVVDEYKTVLKNIEGQFIDVSVNWIHDNQFVLKHTVDNQSTITYEYEYDGNTWKTK